MEEAAQLIGARTAKKPVARKRPIKFLKGAGYCTANLVAFKHVQSRVLTTQPEATEIVERPSTSVVPFHRYLPKLIYKPEFIEFSTSPNRIAAGVSGPLLLGIGSGISISAGFGSFGFSVLLDGLHNIWSAPLWLSQLIITILFFVIAWFWGGIRLGLGTLPALLLVGPAISLGASMTPVALPLEWHAVAFIAGLSMFAFGLSLSAAAALGPDGVTALSLAAEKRLKWPVPRANFVWNFTAIAFGVLLGGNMGPATIIGLIATPMLIRFFLPRLRQRLKY